MFADEIVQVLVALHVIARLDLLAAIRGEGLLAEDFAGQPDAGAEVLPVLFVGHVVEQDRRRRLRIGATSASPAARFRAHRPDMGLEAVALRPPP
jgi:hypothetical protein